MQIEVYKNMLINCYSYKFSNMYSGSANVTLGILFRKIQLLSPQGDVVLRAEQHNFLSKAINIMPFLHIKTMMFEVDKCPWNVYDKDENMIGSIKYIYGYKFEMKLNNNIYHIQLHSKNRLSVCKNDVQVALIEKDWLHFAWKSNYKVLFNSQIDIVIMNFISIFSDLVLFYFREYFFVLGTKSVLYDDAKELGKWKIN